jgi:hypothetical protein
MASEQEEVSHFRGERCSSRGVLAGHFVRAHEFAIAFVFNASLTLEIYWHQANIRVAVRVRPLNPREKDGLVQPVVTCVGKTVRVTVSAERRFDTLASRL